MKKTLLKSVKILDPRKKTPFEGDFLFEGDEIVAISESIDAPSDCDLISGEGLHLAPGFVDIHTHLREPGFEYKEDIASGSKSAVAGGFTTICCMANTDPVNDHAAITQYILNQAEKYAVNRVLPIGAITKGLKGEALSEIGELKEAGCVAISDDGITVMNSQVMRIAMDYAKGLDLPVIDHCIDLHLACNAPMHEGSVSVRLGLNGIPSAAEDIIIARDIALSEMTGAHFHVAHLSTAGGVELVRRAKAKGLRVTAEVTPHHFTLTHEACKDYDTHSKMCPPLREQKDIDALICALSDGTIDCIATDHAPHAIVDKEVEFDQAAMGILGFETAFPLAYRLVLDGKISLLRVIEALTLAPLKVIHLDEKFFEKGARADFVLLDLAKQYRYDVGQSFSKSRNTPFDQWNFQASVEQTWVKGQKVFDRSEREKESL